VGCDAAQVKTFCLFIGYSRSGSSVLGALLDAHPNMIVAHELDVLRILGNDRNGEVDKAGLFDMLVENSRAKAASGRRQGNYAYEVENGWQGRYARLEVVGDKEANQTAQRLWAAPALLTKLQNTVGVPVKFIHVVRDPFDNIATVALKDASTCRGIPPDKYLTYASNVYFGLWTRGVQATRQRVAADRWLTEDMLRGPEATLREVCGFLGQDAPKPYLSQCCALLKKTPHRSRDLLDWPEALTESVARQSRDIDFLARYC
jgi:hypothetical protein